MKTEINHKNMVRALVKSGDDIIASLTPARANLMHMAIGVSGESGELLDAIKKHVIYEKPLDRENVIEELGDIEFYLEGLRQQLDINRLHTLRTNTDKLLTAKNARYSSGTFSNEQAQARADKANEVDTNEA